MRPLFVTLAGAALLSTAFAAVQAVAFATMLAVPVTAATVGNARAADAPPLYRWTEPDGSLTFSPTAPTDGTPYEEVDPMTMRPASAASRENVAPIRRATPRAPSPVAPASADGVPDAPAIGAAVRSPANGASADLDRSSGTAPSSNGPRTVVSNDRNRRCSELGKRVVSLERRLTTPLSPRAMDDTVVQIARYQQSVERHCR